MARLTTLVLLTLSASVAFAQDHPLRALNIEFGIKDAEPTSWNGSVSVDKGEIVKLRGHQFKEGESIGANNSWIARTDAWIPHTGGMHPHELPFPQPSRVQTTGITVYYKAPDDAAFTVKTEHGDFFFKHADLPPSDSMHILATKVEVRRVPPVESVTTDEYEDDYSTMVVSDEGTLSMAWIGYKSENDQVFVRDRSNGSWGEIEGVRNASGDLQGLASAYDGDGALNLVWSKRSGTDWQVMHSKRSGGSWSSPRAITSGMGNNIFPVMASDTQGNLHVAYQSARRGFSQIYYTGLLNGEWSSEVPLSDPGAAANEWYPDIATDTKGTAWVVWDSYEGGSYNIRMRPVREARAGDLMRVTDTPRYHGTPSVAVDAEDRVWITYDESEANWGKDSGFLLRGGAGIYQSRTNRIAIWDGNEWLAPLDDVNRGFRPSIRRYVQTPKLAADGKGRMWLLSRPRVRAVKPESIWAAGGKWDVMATYYSGGKWAVPFQVPEAIGRNEGPLELVAGPDGEMFASWTTDQKLWGGPGFGHYPKENQIHFAELSGQFRDAKIEPAVLGPLGSENPANLPTEPREAEQVAGLRNYTINSGGNRYKIYRGDMHRHTDISLDGSGDGSLHDSFRYMIDAAAMDFYLVTDHKGTNDTEYSWWRTEKAEDMFNVGGKFVTLFGYERSLSYPNGHRNIIYAERGNKPIPITQAERDSSTGPFLYDALRKQNGIATSHTSHTTMGTDWRDNDPELEPIVEIFQGARTSAEHEGAPLASSAARSDLWAGNYRPKGFVWLAWEKGYKLGVQASSDHASTHTSYAMVLAEDYTREGLVNAMRKRHTYASTSNIILDFRMQAGDNEGIQGDEMAATSEIPTVKAVIRGSNDIKEVAVVRNNKYVHTREGKGEHTREGKGERMEFEFREGSLDAGEHYYYVRVEQEDGNVAWSSPIWVTKR